jgi:flagellum-specific peptidoglycan hydrolase FlgJ
MFLQEMNQIFVQHLKNQLRTPVNFLYPTLLWVCLFVSVPGWAQNKPATNPPIKPALKTTISPAEAAKKREEEFARKVAEEKIQKLAYVKQYSWLAVEEMKRTGIPASIKLAQAIVESRWGTSSLSKEGNNHFGLKCGKDWTGISIYKVDVDRDSTGTLVGSCFQSYATIRHSYISHSNYLLSPAKSVRYSYLFKLHPLNYQGWAEGLQKGGYSTNPNYALILIKTIEDLGLRDLDVKVFGEMGGWK